VWTVLLLLVGVAAAAWRVPSPSDATFVLPPRPASAAAPDGPPIHHEIELPTPTPSAHASSIAMMPDGSLRIAWFGGAREGAGDVGIWMAEVSPAGRVGEHWLALARKDLEARLSRVIRIIGNPVVWCDPRGVLRLWVVSVSYGGWSGSSVNALESRDGGRSWENPRRLVVSPLFNLSTLVRAQPVALSDGSIGLPAYHELARKWGLWIRLDESGHMYALERIMPATGSWLQPSVAPLSSTRAIALLRCAVPELAAVGRASSTDAGAAWRAEGTLPIPNPDSGLALLALQDGSLLLAANPSTSNRAKLQLFRSRDNGETWVPSRVVAEAPQGEFSYPCLVQGSDGLVHLSFTRQRKGISLVTFNAQWLDGALP
jgi:predicted neuraminidase